MSVGSSSLSSHFNFKSSKTKETARNPGWTLSGFLKLSRYPTNSRDVPASHFSYFAEAPITKAIKQVLFFIEFYHQTNTTASCSMSGAFKNLFAINPRKRLKAYLQTSVSLLKDFSKQCSITQGSVLHCHLIKMGVSSDNYIAVKLLIMYLNCRKSSEADQILNDFNGFNLVVHNCLISANVDRGNIDEARRLFDEMPERNEVSWTALISGFLKEGRVEEAMSFFQRNPFQNVISWTAAISGLVQNGLTNRAMKLFAEMVQAGVSPNDVTFTSIVRACVGLGDFALGMSVLGLIVKSGFEHNVSVSNSFVTFNLRFGEIDLARRIFDEMEERDVVSWTAILDMYVEMGDLREARRIFDEMPERNEVSWSAMIARYSQSGYAEEAVKLFSQMVQNGFRPNISCFSSVISALATLEALKAGTSIHANVLKIGIERDVFISSSLVDWYCKCGNTEDARLVFDLILEKNVVCWNSMISGYSLNGQLEEAKELFDQIPKKNIASWNSMVAGYLENEQFDKVFEVFNLMLLSGETPDKSNFSSVLCACARIASLGTGKNLHGKIIKLKLQYDTFVGTALTDMYAKSGDIDSSKKVFDRIQSKNEISWTSMIQGLADNGFAEESLNLFEEMLRTSSVAPNELILVAVLFACSHCGLVDKGLWYFSLMEEVYGIKPKEKHYTCVIDMLSRSGRLFEAERFITSMSCQPEVNAWASLLNGCKIHVDDVIAERAAKKICELEEKKSGGYVLLSNIYASAGRWIDVMRTRQLMKEKGLKKSGGCSWVEMSLWSFSEIKLGYPIVEPAHMELAEPSIKDAFASCVQQGVNRVIVSPFFLFPGRHWHQDIPSLTAEAAKEHPGVSYIITAPLGLRELLVGVVNDRTNYCLCHVAGDANEFSVCAGTGKCQLY